jgi:hypothetical protein
MLSFYIEFGEEFSFRNSDVIFSTVYYSDLGFRYESNNESASIHSVEPYCLHGDGIVLMEGGKTKLVKHLTIGDKVISTSLNTIDGGSSTVTTICGIVRTLISSSIADVVNVNSLLITPKHPIRSSTFDVHDASGKEWILPKEIAPVESLHCCELFNFVVENRGSLFVNNVEVCTLGQFCAGIDGEDSYFGSERVVTYLKAQRSWPFVTQTLN